jgi:predicted DCC family thiol-disulfide oxidoreductase YuxK
MIGSPGRVLDAVFARRIDARAVGAFRIVLAATGLFYVAGAIQLVDYAWPGRETLFGVLYAAWLIALALLLAGIWSRPMAAASLVLTLVCNGTPAAGSIGELLWRIAALALVFMRPGDAISVDELRDRWRGRARPVDQPRWPADLAVVSLGLTLLLSGLPKAVDPTWRAGDGFYLAMLLPWTHHPWADAVAGSRALTLAANYAGIAVECGFIVLVFVPALRWAAIAGFVGLMAGFGILMSFYFIGIAGLCFLPLMLPDRRGRLPGAAPGRPLTLLYDGGCGFCHRSVRLLLALDTHNRLEPRPIQDSIALLDAHGVDPSAALDEMHVVDGGRIFHGFEAFRRFAWATPYLVAIAPLLQLPGIPWLGARVYRAVARRRHALGCALGGAPRLAALASPAAPRPRALTRMLATAHVVYLAVFGSAAVLAVAGPSAPLRTLSGWPGVEQYNLYTNDLRPLPLFCEVHLFGVYVYRLEGTTVDGRTVTLLPVFDDRGGPGSCCAGGPRYLQGMMFHVTDDVLRKETVPGYHAPAANLELYRAAVNKAIRESPAPVTEVRMLVKLLDPPRTFAGRVAPWDSERWTPWLRFPVQNGRVHGNLEWLERPPRPTFTARK